MKTVSKYVTGNIASNKSRVLKGFQDVWLLSKILYPANPMGPLREGSCRHSFLLALHEFSRNDIKKQSRIANKVKARNVLDNLLLCNFFISMLAPWIFRNRMYRSTAMKTRHEIVIAPTSLLLVSVIVFKAWWRSGESFLSTYTSRTLNKNVVTASSTPQNKKPAPDNVAIAMCENLWPSTILMARMNKWRFVIAMTIPTKISRMSWCCPQNAVSSYCFCS